MSQTRFSLVLLGPLLVLMLVGLPACSAEDKSKVSPGQIEIRNPYSSPWFCFDVVRLDAKQCACNI